MGQPTKSSIKSKYSDSTAYVSKAEACVTFYTDPIKRKTVAHLIDDNLMAFVTKIINSSLVGDKQINGFLGSFGLDQHRYLTASTTCLESDTFCEVEGKKRALAKVFLRRDVCITNLILLIAENSAKSFSVIEKTFLNKMDAVDLYHAYVDVRCANQDVKQSK